MMNRHVFCALLATAAIVPAWSASASAADRTVLVVLAASSTKPAILDAAAAFEKKHPDVVVQPSFAGSSVILAQLKQGAACDVLLVGATSIAVLPDALSDPVDVARNRLTILIWKGAAAKIHGPADLVEKGIRLGDGVTNSVAAANTRVTVEKIAKDLGPGYPAKFAANVVTTATSNEKMAQALAAGAVDAAILFPSDGVPGKTLEVPLAEKYRTTQTFTAVVVKASAHLALAKEFESLLASADGAAFFRAHGIEPMR
jgi:molybdate transport system substrate-binding protein